MPLLKSHLYDMATYSPPLEGRSVTEHTLLDFNERTVPVSDYVCDALSAYAYSGALQKYPAYGDLQNNVAQYVGVPADHLMLCNGSDQGLDLAIRACVSKGDEVVIPAPSFAIYNQFAQVEGATIIAPLYQCESGYPMSDVKAAISNQTSLVVVPNPNNPCGTVVDAEAIVALAKFAPDVVVLVDECYFEYAKISVVDRVLECPNLVVTRTFSKTWGLPSVRLGAVIAHPDIIAQLMKIRGPYDVNQFAAVAVSAALERPEYTLDYVDTLMTKSKPMLESYLREKNILFWPSQANYLWVFFADAAMVNDVLMAENILVRPKRDSDGRLGLRITLGTPSQTERLISVLNQILAG